MAGANRVSYNGPGGWQARPTASDVAVLREQRTPPMKVQMVRAESSATNRQQFYAENHGRPATAAIAEHQAADKTPPAPFKPLEARPAPTATQPVGRPVRPNGFENRPQGAPAEQPQRGGIPVRPAEQARPGPVVARPQPAAQVRPQPEVHPQPAPRPQPEARPQPEPRPQAAPQPRPEPQARPQAAPRPQATPQARPQPEVHAQPAAHEAPHEEKPKR